MRIVFNLMDVGLGNNGGSKTLIRCAETIADLDNDVIISSQANHYTWHKIRVPVVKYLPKTDIIVATGYGSVKSTIESKAAKKFYYIRGFETWRTSKSNLLASYKALKCIVNSEWLQKYLNEHNIPSELVYPGLDFDIYPLKSASRKNIIGGIFHKKHKTKRHEDVIAVSSKLGAKCVLLNRDVRNPTPNELADFYNTIKVWISPSELEGLHNCPMEASLCGCGLVVTDHPRGGIGDYCIHEKTCLKYISRDLDQAAKYTRRLLEDDAERHELQNNMSHLLHSKIGTRKDNMRRLLELLKVK